MAKGKHTHTHTHTYTHTFTHKSHCQLLASFAVAATSAANISSGQTVSTLHHEQHNHHHQHQQQCLLPSPLLAVLEDGSRTSQPCTRHIQTAKHHHHHHQKVLLWIIIIIIMLMLMLMTMMMRNWQGENLVELAETEALLLSQRCSNSR